MMDWMDGLVYSDLVLIQDGRSVQPHQSASRLLRLPMRRWATEQHFWQLLDEYLPMLLNPLSMLLTCMVDMNYKA